MQIKAVEAVRVETYSQVGRLIHDHLLGHKERADYGTGWSRGFQETRA